MDKRAYYIEYPDRDMAVIIEHHLEGPQIFTGTAENRDYWVNERLPGDGFEVFAFTSSWHGLEGVERQLLHWSKIELETVSS